MISRGLYKDHYSYSDIATFTTVVLHRIATDVREINHYFFNTEHFIWNFIKILNYMHMNIQIIYSLHSPPLVINTLSAFKLHRCSEK